MARARRASPRARGLVAIDVACLVAFTLAMGWSLARIEAVPPLLFWPGMLVAGLIGVAAADLGTGLVHWAGDSFGEEETPIIGPVLIVGFREHHRDPLRIVAHGFVEVSGANALAATPIALGIAALGPEVSTSLWAATGLAFLLAAAVTAVLSNQLHRWAHMARRPRVVRWMQRHRLILSREHHARHHRGAHDRAFCVANGWMNPLLDWLIERRRRASNHGPWART